MARPDGEELNALTAEFELWAEELKRLNSEVLKPPQGDASGLRGPLP